MRPSLALGLSFAVRPAQYEPSASIRFIREISTSWSDSMCWASWKTSDSWPPPPASSCPTIRTAPWWWRIM